MMRITFHEKNVRRAEKSAACGQESIYAGCDGSGKIRYLLNDGSLYENRSCVLKDGGILIVHCTKDSIDHIIHKDGRQRTLRTNIGRTRFCLMTLCRQDGCNMHRNCRL